MPELTEAVCMALSPPPKSRAIATAPSVRAHKILCPTGASSFPPEVILSITNEPLSDEVTKNTDTIKIPIKLVRLLRGNSFKNTKSEVDASLRTGLEIKPGDANSNIKAEPPKVLIQKKVTNVGTNKTPRINSRMVLPLDIRAINIPTKGDHAIHHAQ